MSWASTPPWIEPHVPELRCPQCRRYSPAAEFAHHPGLDETVCDRCYSTHCQACGAAIEANDYCSTCLEEVTDGRSDEASAPAAPHGAAAGDAVAAGLGVRLAAAAAVDVTVEG